MKQQASNFLFVNQYTNLLIQEFHLNGFPSLRIVFLL